MSESEGALRIFDLPEDATNAARNCGELLKQKNTFQKVSIGADSSGEYEIWDTQRGGNLMELCVSFIKTFPQLEKASFVDTLAFEEYVN